MVRKEKLIGFIKRDMKKSQLCCLNTISSDEDLFHHGVKQKKLWKHGAFGTFVLSLNTLSRRNQTAQKL